jgi:hypothetical protein
MQLYDHSDGVKTLKLIVCVCPPPRINKQLNRGRSQCEMDSTVWILLDVTDEVVQGGPVFSQWVLAKTGKKVAA